MKLIIAGSRHLDIPCQMIDWICEKVQITEINEVVSGKAKGIDTAGEAFAERYNMSIAEFPADWDNYGKQAGPIRNKAMAEYADALLLIWDGVSPDQKI